MLLDTALLGLIAKTTAKQWAFRGILLVVVITVLGLVLVPQKFSAMATVAVDQSSSGISEIAALAGTKPSNRDIGILKSRRLASVVAAKADIKHTFHLPTDEVAIEFLQGSLTAEDSQVDGLLDITVTLKGPAHYGPGASERRRVVAAKAAEIANDYVAAFQQYYADNDTDKGSVLIRGADTETKAARADYNRAVSNLANFLASLKRVDPRAVPTAAGAGGTAPASPASTQLESLYAQLNQVETEEQSDQAGLQISQELTGNQIANVGSLTTEDPLLTAARDRVSADKASLASLSVTYGPDHPAIIAAQDHLRTDEAVLAAQIEGVQQHISSQHVNGLATLSSLAAQRSTIEQQIAAATSHLSTGRAIGSVLGRLEAEVDIQLEVLKATMSEAAKVRLDNASAASQTSVVDEAIPAEKGTPGTSIILAAALGIVLFGYLVLVLRQYLQAVANEPISPAPIVPNGTLASVTPISQHDGIEERRS